MNRLKMAALASALALGATAMGMTGSCAASAAASTASPGCIEIGSAGRQTWHGDKATGVAAALGDAVQAIADANQDSISGVSLCSDYSGVSVFASNPSASVLSQIASVRAKFPGLSIAVANVAAGLKAQLAASARLTSMDGSTSSLSGVAPDMYTGGLRVTVQPSAWPVSPALQQQITDAATAQGTVEMPVELRSGKASGQDFTTRLADTQPFYGGDEIVGSAGICSAGVPLLVNGVHTMLTAGHCTSSSFTNNGNHFGNQYTTSYPGNADIYGDWKLLSGESYGLRMFSDTVSSSSTLPITSANWTARSNGLQMCTSGRTSGSICRYFISGSYDTQLIGGVWANNLLDMYHDRTGTGDFADWEGDGPGDSGGPCYYSNGAGGVIAAGIVKGGDSSTLTYWCTQLSGVRAWNSGASLG